MSIRMVRLGAGILLLMQAGVVLGQTTTRVSVATDGAQSDRFSDHSSISANGRYVAFDSFATNLVAGDTNDAEDTFLHDRLTGRITRMSMAIGGVQGNSSSIRPSISADGRYVAFESFASNIVAGDVNGVWDVFVHDRQTGQVGRASTATGGAGGNLGGELASISADGRYVAFRSSSTNLVGGDTNGVADAFVHDRLTGQTARVSVATGGAQGNGNSSEPSISANGRLVAFWSSATNLVPGDTNAVADAFVHDRLTGQTTRVSVATGGAQGNGDSTEPSISADGRLVAFSSSAANLVPGDTNGVADVFVHDRQSGQTTRMSVATGGTQGNGASLRPSVSADGRFVVFESIASNIVAGDTNDTLDVFVHDRQTSQKTRQSLGAGGGQANYENYLPSISADGRLVAFVSYASNLVPGDSNETDDIFVRDRGAAPATATLTVPASVPSCAGSTYPMSVSWSSEGTSFCRAEIPDAVSPTAQPDQCLRGGGQPARGSFWTTVRCPAGLCPYPNDASILAPTQNDQVVQVCQGLLGLSPPQTSINLRLVCTTSSGSTVSSDRTVAIRAPLAGECVAPAYAQSSNLGSPQSAWGGGTELSGAVTGVPPGTELTATLLQEGERGQTTVWMEGNTLKLRYRDNPGPQPLQITETVRVAVSDGASSTQRDYTFTVTSSYVFDNGFE